MTQPPEPPPPEHWLKANLGMLVAHGSTVAGGVASLLMAAAHSPGSIGIIGSAWLGSHVAIHTGHTVAGASISNTQANSPNYPTPAPHPPIIVQPGGTLNVHPGATVTTTPPPEGIVLPKL